MKTKIQISPEMELFNLAVETADTLTDFQFDQEPAALLLAKLKAEGYHYNAEDLANAIAGIAVKR